MILTYFERKVNLLKTYPQDTHNAEWRFTRKSERSEPLLPEIVAHGEEVCQKKWQIHYRKNGNLPLLWAKNYPHSMLRRCIWGLKSRLAVLPLLDAKHSWANMVFLNRMTRLACYVDKKTFFRILPAHYIVIIQPPSKHPVNSELPVNYTLLHTSAHTVTPFLTAYNVI